MFETNDPTLPGPSPVGQKRGYKSWEFNDPPSPMQRCCVFLFPDKRTDTKRENNDHLFCRRGLVDQKIEALKNLMPLCFCSS